jgi:16S rRNA (uracil1498-N3)-methyltransferase
VIRAPIRGLGTTLDAETSRYLTRVRRLGPGDRFVAFDPDAKTEADAVLVDDRTIALTNERPASVVAERELVLVYCLAKGDKVDDVVRDATELGASRVIVARAERSVVKADADRAEAKRARWMRIAEQAARQCERGDTPTIEGVLDWEAALERAAGCDARFVLDPHASEPLGSLLHTSVTNGASVAFAIGPEGGLAPREIAFAQGRGWVATSLGKLVLRTETVAAAVLGAVMLAARP